MVSTCHQFTLNYISGIHQLQGPRRVYCILAYLAYFLLHNCIFTLDFLHNCISKTFFALLHIDFILCISAYCDEFLHIFFKSIKFFPLALLAIYYLNIQDAFFQTHFSLLALLAILSYIMYTSIMCQDIYSSYHGYKRQF